MRLVDADGQHPDFADLCRALDEFLNQAAGGEQNRAAYLPHNTRDDIHDVILAYDGARAVGCAALRRLDDRRAEVKRVFVRPEYRGRGIARQMMGRLEDLARCQGYAELVLGDRPPAHRRRGSLPRAGVWGDAATAPMPICPSRCACARSWPANSGGQTKEKMAALRAAI